MVEMKEMASLRPRTKSELKRAPEIGFLFYSNVT